MMDTLELTLQYRRGDQRPVVAEHHRPGELPGRSEGRIELKPDFRPPGIGFFQPSNRLNRRPNRRLLDKFSAPNEYDYWTIFLV